MRTQAVKDYIDCHQELFWYTPSPKSEKVSDDLLVETILNYGTMGDVRELFDVMGIKKVTRIFSCFTDRKKLNIFPEAHNYFELFLTNMHQKNRIYARIFC